MTTVKTHVEGTIQRPDQLDSYANLVEPFDSDALNLSEAVNFARYATEREEIAKIATDSADRWVFHSGVQHARITMAEAMLLKLIDWHDGKPLGAGFRLLLDHEGEVGLIRKVIAILHGNADEFSDEPGAQAS